MVEVVRLESGYVVNRGARVQIPPSPPFLSNSKLKRLRKKDEKILDKPETM